MFHKLSAVAYELPLSGVVLSTFSYPLIHLRSSSTEVMCVCIYIYIYIYKLTWIKFNPSKFSYNFLLDMNFENLILDCMFFMYLACMSNLIQIGCYLLFD